MAGYLTLASQREKSLSEITILEKQNFESLFISLEKQCERNREKKVNNGTITCHTSPHRMP